MFVCVFNFFSGTAYLIELKFYAGFCHEKTQVRGWLFSNQQLWVVDRWVSQKYLKTCLRGVEKNSKFLLRGIEKFFIAWLWMGFLIPNVQHELRIVEDIFEYSRISLKGYQWVHEVVPAIWKCSLYRKSTKKGLLQT